MEVLPLLVSAGVGAAFVVGTTLSLLDERRRVRGQRLLGERSWGADRAAFEASLEDERFDPDEIRAAIARLGSRRRGLRSLLGFDTQYVTARWTLGRADASWLVRDIADGTPGDTALSAPLIPGAWADDQRLRIESTLELAAADALQTDSIDPDSIDQTRPPTDMLADLALVDARFGADVLDMVLRRLLDAWQTPEPSRLRALAGRRAADRLLHPAAAPDAATVVHDLTIAGWAPRLIRASAPTALDLFVQLEGIRYVAVAGEAALLGGSQDVRHPITVTWTLTLVTDHTKAWHLDDSSDPAPRLQWRP